MKKIPWKQPLAKTSLENWLFTNVQPHIFCSVTFYQTANFLKVKGRLEEEINQWPKRLREENNPSPDIFVETPSTATLVEEPRTVNPNFLSPETRNQKRNNYLLSI